jgi:hypothetical protein
LASIVFSKLLFDASFAQYATWGCQFCTAVSFTRPSAETHLHHASGSTRRAECTRQSRLEPDQVERRRRAAVGDGTDLLEDSLVATFVISIVSGAHRISGSLGPTNLS